MILTTHISAEVKKEVVTHSLPVCIHIGTTALN